MYFLMNNMKNLLCLNIVNIIKYIYIYWGIEFKYRNNCFSFFPKAHEVAFFCVWQKD